MVESTRTSTVKKKKETPAPQPRHPVRPQTLSSPADRILFLQRTAGNKAVQRLMASGELQTKFRVGATGDKFELEADKIAEQVTSSKVIQPLNTTFIKEEEKTLRRDAEPGTAITSVNEDFIQKSGIGQPINPSTRSAIESHIGADLGSVRVHSDAASHEAASSLNARAFTYKNDIYLGGGESQDNVRLIAHEATHVVQQGAAVQRSPAIVTPAPAGIQRWDLIGGIKNLAGKATEAVGGAIGGAKDWVLGKVSELVVNIPGFFLLCVMLGRNPVTDKPVERNAINLIHGILGLIPGGEAIFQNLQKSGAIDEAFAWLNDQIAKLNLTWQSIKGLFNQAWDSLSIVDAASPGKAFEKIKSIFGPPLERIKNFAVAAGKKILDFIFEGVLKLAGPLGTKVLGIIKKAGNVISTIINDPVGFLKNLIHAVRKGFDQFSGNILTHLKEGLMKWLFGTLSDAGLKLPEKFDLMGILSIVLQVLGLTYYKLRGKLVKVLGEKPVAYIEKAFEFLYLIFTKGLAAAWEKFLEFIGDLKDMVISAIRDWVVTTIVKKAITKLVSMFNPVGAIVQAIIMVYDTVTFFIERFKQIMELAEAVFDSIANIAAGKLDAAANYVEKTMARTIPVIIGFLAGLIGLGGISEKIKKVIEGIQAKVDMALDKIVNFIVTKAKALFDKGEKKEIDTPEKQWEKGVKGVKEAISHLKKEEMTEEKIKPLIPKWEKDFGFKSLTLNTKTTPWKIEGKINPEGEVTWVEAGGEGPEVDTYAALKGKSKKGMEAHHVPPKGLLGWLVKQADTVIKSFLKGKNKVLDKFIWIQKLSKVEKSTYDPGGPIAAISINEHTHIKKQNDPEKDVWRVHFGEETAKEVFRRLDGKGLTLIYRRQFNELSEEDKENYKEMVLESNEKLEKPESDELKEKVGRSAISTQFFSTELNAALEKKQKKEIEEIEQFQENVGSVAQGAAAIAHEAVAVSLEKSKLDGSIEQRKSALAKLKDLSSSTWNKVPGIAYLNIFK